MRPWQDNGWRRRDGKAAFTMVEVLVSVAILVLLIAMLGQILRITSSSWNLGEATSVRMRNERAIGDYIVNQLQGALLPLDRTSQTDLQFVVNPSGLSAATYNNSDTVFWQAPVASDQTLGDVAEVGYFVQWDTTTNPKVPQAQLCQFFVNPGSGTTPNPLFDIYTNPTAWLSDSILQAAAPANNAVDPATNTVNAYRGLFAENVIGLWVQCLDSYGQPITSDYNGKSLQTSQGDYGYDSRNGYTDSTGAKSASYTYIDSAGNTQTAPLCALPPMIRLSLVLLDAQSASRLGAAQKADIVSLVTSSAVTTSSSPAKTFVTSAMTHPVLVGIEAGLRSYQTQIYLQNSK